jgi:flagellar biosynthesis/type III secretory pathway protein FliH
MSKSQSKEFKDDKLVGTTYFASRARSPSFDLDEAKEEEDAAVTAEAKAAAKAVMDEKIAHARRRRSESKVDEGLGTGAFAGIAEAPSEDDEAAAVEREFQALLKSRNTGDVFVSSDPRAQEIVEGLKMYARHALSMYASLCFYHCNISLMYAEWSLR